MSKVQAVFHFSSRKLLNARIDCKAWWDAGNISNSSSGMAIVSYEAKFVREQNKFLLRAPDMWLCLLKVAAKPRKFSTHLAFDLGRVVHEWSYSVLVGKGLFSAEEHPNMISEKKSYNN